MPGSPGAGPDFSIQLSTLKTQPSRVRLLTKTNRYYVLLAAVLFALGGGALYGSLNWALRSEVDEQLLDQQQELTAAGAAARPAFSSGFASTTPPPTRRAWA